MRRLLLAALAIVLAGTGIAAPAGAAPADQSYLARWHAERLWAAGANGHGITIAEIDSGVDGSLPVLAGRLRPGHDFGRLGGDGTTDRDTDPFGHGTAMASIMVGRPGVLGIRGLAPAAKVMPIAIPISGTTDEASDDHLAAAIRWATGHGAKIISMSVGGVRRAGDGSLSCPAAEQDAIFDALRAGALVFAASGNRGGGDNAVEEPSVCLGVVSVGAVTESGEHARFSSSHPYLTLSAPGVGIASIGPGGKPFSGNGTSQATALAAASAALVWSARPALTASRVLARIIATTDRHSPTRDPSYGYGIVNPYRAVTAQVPLSSPDPVYSAVAPFLATPAAVSIPSPPAPASAIADPRGTFRVTPPAVPARRSPWPGIGLVVISALVLGLLIVVELRGRYRAAAAARLEHESIEVAPLSRE